MPGHFSWAYVCGKFVRHLSVSSDLFPVQCILRALEICGLLLHTLLCYHARAARRDRWRLAAVFTPTAADGTLNPDVVPKDDPMAAFEGKKGAKLWVVSAESGEKLKEYGLSRLPAFDGLIAAYGNLYLSTKDGYLMCIGDKKGGELLVTLAK